MHAIPIRSSVPAPAAGDGPFPWEEAHAAPEDRAVGLELELIELVARRQSAVVGGGEARALDMEIDRILAELGDIEPALPLVS